MHHVCIWTFFPTRFEAGRNCRVSPESSHNTQDLMNVLYLGNIMGRQSKVDVIHVLMKTTGGSDYAKIIKLETILMFIDCTPSQIINSEIQCF